MTGTASTGVVVAAHRRHYAVRLDTGGTLDCVLKGRSAQIACGDRVGVLRVAGGGAIESMEPRQSLLYRSDAHKEKLLAANVTQIVGVVAPDLALDEGLLNRWTVAAAAEGCRAIIAANKSDLATFPALRERLAPYRALGYAVLELAAKRDAGPLLPWLHGQRSVLIGQSGMGKSTLINALVPDAGARTSEVSAALKTGRHTTAGTVLYPLPQCGPGAWIVDSPGMKAFGLAHLAPDAIVHAFADIAPLVEQCRFRDCRHAGEPGCAVQDAVDAGRIHPKRVELLHALVRESEAARDPAR